MRKYDSSSTIALCSKDLPRLLRTTSFVGYERDLSNRHVKNRNRKMTAKACYWEPLSSKIRSRFANTFVRRLSTNP